MRKTASACHNCANECPRQAIDYVGTKYQIDPDKCVECGLCARVCHTQSISNVDEPETVVPHPVVEKECDVVVLRRRHRPGGGGPRGSGGQEGHPGRKGQGAGRKHRLCPRLFPPCIPSGTARRACPTAGSRPSSIIKKVTDGELEEDVLARRCTDAARVFDWLCEFGTCHQVYNRSIWATPTPTASSTAPACWTSTAASGTT